MWGRKWQRRREIGYIKVVLKYVNRDKDNGCQDAHCNTFLEKYKLQMDYKWKGNGLQIWKGRKLA